MIFLQHFSYLQYKFHFHCPLSQPSNHWVEKKQPSQVHCTKTMKEYMYNSDNCSYDESFDFRLLTQVDQRNLWRMWWHRTSCSENLGRELGLVSSAALLGGALKKFLILLLKFMIFLIIAVYDIWEDVGAWKVLLWDMPMICLQVCYVS